MYRADTRTATVAIDVAGREGREMPPVPVGYPYNEHGCYVAAADGSTLGGLQPWEDG